MTLTPEKLAEWRRLCEEANGPHFHDARTQAEYSAAARSAMPELLAEVERLTRLQEEYRSATDKLLTSRSNDLLAVAKERDELKIEVERLTETHKAMRAFEVEIIRDEQALRIKNTQLTKERDESTRDANRWLVAFTKAENEIKRLREMLKPFDRVPVLKSNNPGLVDSALIFGAITFGDLRRAALALIPPHTSQEGGRK